MDLPIDVPLKRPFTVGETKYEVLSFDEPDLATQIAYAELEETFPRLKKVKQDDGSMLAVHSPITASKVNLFWIARLADIPESVAGKIKASDIDAINAAVETVLKIGSDTDTGAGDTPGNAPPAK